MSSWSKVEQDDFRTLAMSELDAVVRLAHHLAHRSDEAEDLVQETYLRAFKAHATFKQTEHGVRPWLFKILHNVLNTRLSKDQRQRSLVAELQKQPVPADSGAADFGAADPGADSDIPNLSAVDWETVDERLKAAIHELPLVHRTVFLLCAVEGLRYREIADVLEVPVGTVMSRLYRSRAILSRMLSDLAWEKGIAVGEKSQGNEMSERPRR